MHNSVDRPASTNRRHILKGCGAVIAAPFLSRISIADSFPSRPIKMIVPFGVAGPNDIVARVMSEPLGRLLGGTVVVENKVGASGNIGTGFVARSEPDGYTILAASSNFVINKFLTDDAPYDPLADFIPLVELAEAPSAFAVRPELGAKNLTEFIELAKKTNNFSYSHPGFGTVSHLAGEFLKIRAGFSMTSVPHNGGGPAMQTLLTGAVELCSAALPAIEPFVKSGLAVGLGVTSDKRWPTLPDMPTVSEMGYPDFNLANFTAFLAPSKTPAEIVDRLSKASIEILNRREIKAQLLNLGFEVTARPPDVLKERIERELPFWKKLVGEAGIKPT